MFRSTMVVLGCVCMLGTFAATASAAPADTWTPSERCSPASGTRGNRATRAGAAAPLAGATGTRGLSFLRATAHPTWVINEMLDAIPWTLGGRSPIAQVATAPPVVSVDDYSDRWTGSWAVEGSEDALHLEESGSNLVMVGLEHRDAARERDRDDIRAREPHDDRGADRYHDGR